jgi:hypothetical protein
MLEGLPSHEVPDGLADAAIRAKERAALAAAASELTRMSKNLDVWLGEVDRRFAGIVEEEIAASSSETVLGPLSSELGALTKSLAARIEAARSDAAHAAEKIAQRAQATFAAHGKEEARLALYLDEHPEAKEVATERVRLEARRAELVILSRRLDARKTNLAALFAERRGLATHLSDLRRTLFLARDRVVAELREALAPEVIVHLDEASGRTSYAALLTEIIDRAVQKTVIDNIAAHLPPEALAAAIRANDPSPLEAVDRSKTDHANRARKVLNILRESGRVFDIEMVTVDDVVRLTITHVGVAKSPGSPGQKAAAILPMLFHRAEGPLFVDQPEDSLDGTYIFAQLVPRLREAMKRQQLVIVTHHANIPVLAPAKRVAYVESTGTQGHIAEAGTVDEVCGTIEKTCEGGKEAFRLRGEQYGYRVER